MWTSLDGFRNHKDYIIRNRSSIISTKTRPGAFCDIPVGHKLLLLKNENKVEKTKTNHSIKKHILNTISENFKAQIKNRFALNSTEWELLD